MCLGGAYWSGITRLVSAAEREDAERLDVNDGRVFEDLLSCLATRGMTIRRGFLRDEAQSVLAR